MAKLFSLTIPMLAIFITGCSVMNLNTPSQDTSTQNSQSAAITLPYTARFAIYTNNTFRVFTSEKYHNQLPDVYIEAKSPNIIQVTKTEITWATFLRSIHLQIDANCLVTGLGERFCTNPTKTLKFYLNGNRVENLLEREIKPGDKALISFGSETQEQIENQLEKLNSL